MAFSGESIILFQCNVKCTDINDLVIRNHTLTYTQCQTIVL